MMTWWQQRSQREQRAMTLAALVVGAFILWTLVWLPAQRSRDAQAERLITAQTQLQWMRQAQTEVQHLRQSREEPRKTRGDQSLLALVDETARMAGLGGAFSRGEPLDDSSVRVWLDGAEFDSLMRWLEQLAASYGIAATELNVNPDTTTGKVNARVRLEEVG